MSVPAWIHARRATLRPKHAPRSPLRQRDARRPPAQDTQVALVPDGENLTVTEALTW